MMINDCDPTSIGIWSYWCFSVFAWIGRSICVLLVVSSLECWFNEIGDKTNSFSSSCWLLPLGLCCCSFSFQISILKGYHVGSKKRIKIEYEWDQRRRKSIYIFHQNHFIDHRSRLCRVREWKKTRRTENPGQEKMTDGERKSNLWPLL
jgi:hypothetical protein